MARIALRQQRLGAIVVNRKICFVLVVIALIGAVGCGEKADPATAEKETQKQATEQANSGENN